MGTMGSAESQNRAHSVGEENKAENKMFAKLQKKVAF